MVCRLLGGTRSSLERRPKGWNLIFRSWEVLPGQSTVFYDGDEVVGGGWIV
jgi:tRNA U34 2-thiouridine synthase MnmA/TrmU